MQGGRGLAGYFGKKGPALWPFAPGRGTIPVSNKTGGGGHGKENSAAGAGPGRDAAQRGQADHPQDPGGAGAGQAAGGSDGACDRPPAQGLPPAVLSLRGCGTRSPPTGPPFGTWWSSGCCWKSIWPLPSACRCWPVRPHSHVRQVFRAGVGYLSRPDYETLRARYAGTAMLQYHLGYPGRSCRERWRNSCGGCPPGGGAFLPHRQSPDQAGPAGSASRTCRASALPIPFPMTWR